MYKNFGQSLTYPKLLLNIKCISREHICERWACERFHPDAMCPRYKNLTEEISDALEIYLEMFPVFLSRISFETML